MKLPQTSTDLTKLIENKVQESLHLDYKDSRAIDSKKKGDIAKDVSAFANSDGGLLIYGIQERGHLPDALDDGVSNSSYDREWLEQVINSNISPRIEGVEISQIPISQETSAFCVLVPKSFRAPHQDMVTKKYFKRFNFQSVPMENYEIVDVRSRVDTVRPLVTIDVEIRHRVMVYLVIENAGKSAVTDVEFEITPPLKWRAGNEDPPAILREGIKYFSPGKKHLIFYESYTRIANDEGIPASFVVEVRYFHPIAQKTIREEYPINLDDYMNTSIPESDIYEVGGKVEKAINNLAKKVDHLGGHVEKLTALVTPTGLSLSYRGLNDLRELLSGSSYFKRYSPRYQTPDFFEEVLGVDSLLARRLSAYFRFSPEGKYLDEIEGVTEELLQLMRSRLLLRDEDCDR